MATATAAFASAGRPCRDSVREVLDTPAVDDRTADPGPDDAAVVGLAGVLAHVVAELGQHVVGGLDVLRARDRLDCIDPVEQAVRRRQAIRVGQLY